MEYKSLAVGHVSASRRSFVLEWAAGWSDPVQVRSQLRETLIYRPWPAHVRGATVDLPVFDRDAVADGAMITGPAAIEEPGATTFVEPGWFACLDPRGNLLLTREGAS